jgi:hypothetical protein
MPTAPLQSSVAGSTLERSGDDGEERRGTADRTGGGDRVVEMELAGGSAAGNGF